MDVLKVVRRSKTLRVFQAKSEKMFVYQLEELIPHTRYSKEYQMKMNEKDSDK